MTYGGDAWDNAKTIVQTNNGNIIIAGKVKSYNEVMWLVRTTEKGKKIWSQIYQNYPVISPESIIESSDNSIVIAGYNAEHDSMPRNLWVVKLDTLGKIIWEKNYDGKGDSYASKIIETQDKGFAIAGYTSTALDEPPDWWILKLDSIGNFMWDDSYGSTTSDKALGIAELPDRSIVATGFMTNTGGIYRKIGLAKYDEFGSNLFYNEYKISVWDEPTSVIATSDTALLISGYTRFDPLIDFDAFIMKISVNGDSLWTSTYPSEKWEHTTNVIETYDKGFAVGATSRTGYEMQNNYLLIKFDSKGNFTWQETFKRKSNDFVAQIIETEDNGILIAGSTSHFGNALDFGLLKYKSLDRSEIIFKTPIDSILSINIDSTSIETCIQEFDKPKKVDVFINDIYVTSISKFEESPDPDCDYIFNYNAKLENGINTIRFEITDFKDFKFNGQRIIYYIPSPSIIW